MAETTNPDVAPQLRRNGDLLRKSHCGPMSKTRPSGLETILVSDQGLLGKQYAAVAKAVSAAPRDDESTGPRPNDPAIFLAVAIFVAVISILAAYIPARRAAGIQPLAALRED